MINYYNGISLIEQRTIWWLDKHLTCKRASLHHRSWSRLSKTFEIDTLPPYTHRDVALVSQEDAEEEVTVVTESKF